MCKKSLLLSFQPQRLRFTTSQNHTPRYVRNYIIINIIYILYYYGDFTKTQRCVNWWKCEVEKFFCIFLRKKLEKGKCLTYLCIVIWKRIAHVSVTFGVRTRCVRVRQHNNANLTFRAQNKDNSPNPIRHNSKKNESRTDHTNREPERGA